MEHLEWFLLLSWFGVKVFHSIIMWTVIRKFGLEYSDLSTMIENANFFLRLLTLNIDSRVKTRIPLACYLVTGSCTICYYCALQFSVIWFVFWRSVQTKDLTAAMVVSSLGVSSLTATIKLFYMLVHASKVRSLVDQCLESDALTEPHSRFSRNMRKALRNVKLRAMSYWICVMVNAILYVVVPIFLPGRHLPEDMFVYYGLEPQFETPNYEISFTIMFTCVIFICYMAATVAVFNIIIIGYTEAQMISLSKEILFLWKDSSENIVESNLYSTLTVFGNKKSFIDNEKRIKINFHVRKELIKILRNHSRIVTVLRNVDQCFNVPNAVAFGCLGISLIAELLGGLENTFLQVPFTFVQIAIECYIGQKIMDASLTFEKAVYSCKWENFDKDNMKIVLLMLQNSQKTLTVSAGGMAVLNFSCLMSIVRMVYSAYTTLRSMM